MPILQSTYNFLVPAAGGTSAYTITQPTDVDTFNSGQITSISGQPFTPSGIIINNVNGTNNAVVRIEPIGFEIVCPAGAQMGMAYPAVLDHSATFTDCDGAVLTFVDYPVIPYLFQL
jgi:hypothetical protein